MTMVRSMAGALPPGYNRAWLKKEYGALLLCMARGPLGRSGSRRVPRGVARAGPCAPCATILATVRREALDRESLRVRVSRVSCSRACAHVW